MHALCIYTMPYTYTLYPDRERYCSIVCVCACLCVCCLNCCCLFVVIVIIFIVCCCRCWDSHFPLIFVPAVAVAIAIVVVGVVAFFSLRFSHFLQFHTIFFSVFFLVLLLHIPFVCFQFFSVCILVCVLMPFVLLENIIHFSSFLLWCFFPPFSISLSLISRPCVDGFDVSVRVDSACVCVCVHTFCVPHHTQSLYIVTMIITFNSRRTQVFYSHALFHFICSPFSHFCRHPFVYSIILFFSFVFS